MRRIVDSARSPGAGGWPRPSLTWQRWHDRALNSGPSPSEDAVEAGADTQSFLKMPSPTRKSSWRSNGMFADGCEKASRSGVLNVVAAPPGRRS